MVFRKTLCVTLLLLATILGENRSLENDSNSKNTTTDTPCAEAPCRNGATCSNDGDDFKCTCAAGYSGKRCETRNTATCSATGDPHYRTFDGKTYDFMGFCEYVLSKDKDNRFEVLTKNEPCNNRYSCVASVTVFVKGLKLKITRGGKFTVFGIPKEVTKTQPYFIPGGMVKRKEKGIQINTDIGVTVEYDGVYNVFVTIHSRYREMTAGLCGNYNGDINDEYIGQNSHLSDSIVDFTDSWKVDQSCANSPIPENPCLTASSIAQDAKMKCQLLKKPPFEKCHNSVNQDSGFIQDCEYDVCACKNHPSSCLCEEFAAYATSCSLVGVPITWKNPDQFPECNTPCAEAPCRNGATCSNDDDDFKCTCAAGYAGKRCETRNYTCPPNSTFFDGRCYYISPRTAKTWLTARAHCRARGDDLAVPTSKIHNQHIYKAIRASNVRAVFLGLFRVGEGLGTNMFYTVRGVEPSYTNWYKAEPSDHGGKEDCVELVYKKPYFENGGDVGGQWNDMACKGYPRHYVCQTSFTQY